MSSGSLLEIYWKFVQLDLETPCIPCSSIPYIFTLPKLRIFDHVLIQNANMSSTFTLGSQQMFKVMSLHVDAGLKSLPALSDSLVNDGLSKI